MQRLLNQIPLNALRGFEAAARRLSFDDAAKELGVTPSAVSMQIRRLEDRIGRPLFLRGHRSVALSETGKRLAPGLTALFNDIDQLLGDVVGPTTASLRISAMPSFASRWLAPRIAGFAVDYPQYDLRIAGEDILMSFVGEDVDIGVRYGPGGYPGLFSSRIANVMASPVCSPAFAALHADRLASVEGAAELTLLHDEVGDVAPGLPTWANWFAGAGAAMCATRGPRFESHHMALTAAESGQGLALGLTPLIDDALARGALVRPYTFALASPYAFWFVCRQDRARERKVSAILRWITAQMEAEQRHG